MIETSDSTQQPSVNSAEKHNSSNEALDQINPSDRLVPVGEAIRYRKRAQTAEQQLECLNQELRDIGTKLDEANQTIVGLERRQKTDDLLVESDAIDLEAARLLTEQAVLMMDEPDIRMAVEDLRRHKPYLFRRKHDPDHSAMAPAIQPTGHEQAQHAAQKAARTGDRRDLLRYLRLRRAR